MANLLRAGKVTLLLLSFSGLGAQIPLPPDTIRIEEVIITRKQISSDQPGFKYFSVDSGRLQDFSQLTLNDVLRETSPLYIKEYGAGLSATSSFRGTSAGHTKVTWNGVTINDPMLGQADFSLIPAIMADNVLVSFGGASMDLGSGGIGGVINIGNEAVWKKETTIIGSPSAGSFGRYSGLLKVSTGDTSFQSVTRAFINSAKNNFSYLDSEALPEPVNKKRENNEIISKGFMQELYIRNSDDVLSARIWYQSASRKLPGSLLYGYMGEQQKDMSLRTMVSYDALKGDMDFFISAAHMLSDMFYSSMYDTAGTSNRVNSVILRGGMTIPLGDFTRLKMVMNDELSFAASDYYLENVTHNQASLTVSAERKKGRWIGAALLIRQMLSDGKLLIPDFSAGIEMRTLRGEEHYLKLNAARNSRIPSLNDRFWNPGGNPDLKNEYAFSIEAGYSLSHQLGNSLSLSSELNYFNNYIRNMIQWFPNSSFYWTAGNIGKANTKGIEYSLAMKYHPGNLLFDFSGVWSYTDARDITSSETRGKHLVYVPRHKVNGIIRIAYNNLFTEWMTGFTGRTYTSADNTSVLDNYLINSITAGFGIHPGKTSADIRMRIDNIFNRQYQTIQYYPQPGRSFLISLTLKFRT
ncbi:MAG TPA: TonB-dependent receptor [Bacteroidales bacterium]|nr:TonB-dependent receptor [Bacteroidales bacterium]HPJ58616.1 TonB-dependent receptor [Bacteroidales bacterium]HRW85491.1 TonB-dependent receptor [Bacteroidales bacterium]